MKVRQSRTFKSNHSELEFTYFDAEAIEHLPSFISALIAFWKSAPRLFHVCNPYNMTDFSSMPQVVGCEIIDCFTSTQMRQANVRRTPTGFIAVLYPIACSRCERGVSSRAV